MLVYFVIIEVTYDDTHSILPVQASIRRRMGYPARDAGL